MTWFCFQLFSDKFYVTAITSKSFSTGENEMTIESTVFD